MIDPMKAPRVGGLYSPRVGVRDSTNERTDIRTNATDAHHQDHREDPRVSYSAGPVDNGVFDG